MASAIRFPMSQTLPSGLCVTCWLVSDILRHLLACVTWKVPSSGLCLGYSVTYWVVPLPLMLFEVMCHLWTCVGRSFGHLQPCAESKCCHVIFACHLWAPAVPANCCHSLIVEWNQKAVALRWLRSQDGRFAAEYQGLGADNSRSVRGETTIYGRGSQRV